MRPCLLLVGALCAFAIGAPVAQAGTAGAGYAATDYVTGFPTFGDRVGLLGLAFDQSDRLFVIDRGDSRLYSFPPGGGQASDATAVSATAIPGVPFGLAITRDGHMYASRYGPQDIVELDPARGTVLRVAARGIACPLGLAVDPLSGDLFVGQDQGCGGGLYRVSGFANGVGTVTRYASIEYVDGVGFDNAGTLYAAAQGVVYAIGSTASPQPATVTPIANVPTADGITFGVRSAGGGLPFLVANRNDGIITKVDFRQNPAVTSDIYTGGTRGDFTAVDSQGCLYATQTSTIVRVTPASGSCQEGDFRLTPTTPGTPAQVVAGQTLACAERRLVLVDVFRRGNRVVLKGIADPALAGQRVSIVFRVTGRTVASAVVAPDGAFGATAPVPARAVRDTNVARYQARLGSERSLDLKLHRRMTVTSLTSANGQVTISGRIAAPLGRPVSTVTVQRRVTCTRDGAVAKVRPRPDGRFTVTIAAPPRTQVAVYRATARVPKNTRNPKRYPTFTLPRTVELR
jgi:streptogramin lyase